MRDLAQRIYPGLADNLRPAAERNVAAHLAKLAAEGHAADTWRGWTKR